jgi:hypothetical protein
MQWTLLLLEMGSWVVLSNASPHYCCFNLPSALWSSESFYQEYKHSGDVNYGNTIKPYISFAIAKTDWMFLFVCVSCEWNWVVHIIDFICIPAQLMGSVCTPSNLLIGNSSYELPRSMLQEEFSYSFLWNSLIFCLRISYLVA